ncbi:MAG: MYXO-CTERM sorting domain-containing protein [Deltaproteobacteria bacterium]
MRRPPSAATALFALALVAGSSTEARAYLCDAPAGPSLAWVARCVPLTFAENDELLSDSGNANAVVAGFGLWTAPGCTDFSFPRGPDGPSPPNGVYVVTEASLDPSVVVNTITNYRPSTGEIFGATLELSPTATFGNVGDPCEGVVDLTNATAVEVGRVLGFIHDPSTSQTIFGSNLVCVPRFTSIGTDDEMGMCAVYPTGEDVLTCAPPADGYGESELRPNCEEAGLALDAPCTRDSDCRSGLECDPVRNTCRLDLSSRGCACTTTGEREGAASPWSAAFLLLAGIRRRRYALKR